MCSKASIFIGSRAGTLTSNSDRKVAGLIALMLLTEARRRPGSGQPRTPYLLVRGRLATGLAPGRYQILAAISGRRR
jgi:hypothetical protein